jgi:putative methyltransferase (TIGR04325 family)
LSSVLQYLEDPKYWIKYISDLKIPYIIIDRTSITHYFRDIITVQNVKEEIYQASYPCWFFNENEFLNLFDTYEVIFEFDSFCDFPLTINDQTGVFWKGYLLKLKS